MEEIIREYVDKIGVFGLERYLIGCVNGMAKNEELTDEEKLENIEELIDEYGKVTNEIEPKIKEMFDKEFKLEMILIGTLYQIASDKISKNINKIEAIKTLILNYKEATGWAALESDPEFQRIAEKAYKIFEDADDIEIVRTPYRPNGNSYLN